MEESWELKPKIEALLIASDRPVSLAALAECLGVSEDQADEALREFEADLLGADRGIEVRRRPHGVRIETKAQYADLIGVSCPSAGRNRTPRRLLKPWPSWPSSSRSQPATSTPSAASRAPQPSRRCSIAS